MREPSASQVLILWPRPWGLLVLFLMSFRAAAAPPQAPPVDSPRPEASPHAPAPAAPAAEPLGESPEETLARARQAYARGEHGAVVAIARALLYPEPRLAGESEIAAHRLLALSYVRLHENRLAEQEFHTLLQLREDFALDLIDPPQARLMLDRIRRHNREKLDRILEQRRREESERKQREIEAQTPPPAPVPVPVPRLVLERTIEKHSRLVSLVPFGVGQFQNGERKKGFALLATESFFAAASVSLFASILIIFPNGRYRTSSDPTLDQTRLARGLQLSQVLTGAVFWAEVLYGLIDAQVHFVPQVVRERKLPDSSGAFVPGRPTVAPLVLSGGGGLAIGGVF